MSRQLAPLYARLADAGQSRWVDVLQTSATEIMCPSRHGHMEAWQQAIHDLPDNQAARTNFRSAAVTFNGEYSRQQQRQLARTLRTFHPWRKGPFEIFGIQLDAEWRSDLKWQRVAPHVDLQDKDVLDVGCGNGYYGWRMLGEGASLVLGLEPYPLYNMQYAVFRNYALEVPHYIIPATDQVLMPALQLFDVAFSMGVFYHCKNPVGHLEAVRHAIKPGGTLVLETIVIDGDADACLVPSERYAKMRNVWLLPSSMLLCRLLQRVGFKHIEIVDETRTTTEEQRSTDWMTFESLSDFLNPNDALVTIEGHPAPKRAVVIAQK